MAQGNSRNIIVGAAALYISVKDSLDSSFYQSSTSDVPAPAVPSLTSGQSARVAFDAATTVWRFAGFTQEGVEIAYEPDYGEVEVDQLLDAAKMYKQKMTVSVKTTLVEGTLENLMVAWAQSPNATEGLPVSYYDDAGASFDGITLNADDEHLGISAGALGVEPVERSLAFVGLAPAKAGKKRERIYHARRALQVESSTHGLKRAEATVFPVSFRLLPASVSGAEYGSIRDRVITTS
jgi:hypothetical protein